MVKRGLLGAMILIGALATAYGAAARQGTPASGEPIKVAFVYVGPIGDLGWTWAHDQGRQELEKNIPNVETAYQENVPENATGCPVPFGKTKT